MSEHIDYVASVVNLSHHYGGVVAVDEINLQIPAGCMVGLVGPDGVGKSSLLALISGVRQIQQGEVNVLAGDMRSRRHRALVCPRIAYMPQGLGRNLYMTLSVFENVDFFGRLFGQHRSERIKRIDELLARTGLTPFRDRPAGKLSGGMKQKLGLCCALIHDPDLLILDEPTTGVDPLSRRQFWELINSIRERRNGMSVLVATAYMEEAEGFDWLVAMDDGKVLATGTPDELLRANHDSDLDTAFIHLLPIEKRKDHKTLVVPPRKHSGDGIPAIKAEGLTMRFGDFTAVDHVNLDIERGEIFGFLGSNGCGKTTTMKMLTGLLQATEGEARLFNHIVDTKDLSTRKRVGFMSQGFSLYTELTVRQNLELHARLFHLPVEGIPDRVAEMIKRFNLKSYEDEISVKLPLGIRQRLSLAVAVIHAPEMLILDEPTSGVDPVARDQFWELLVELSRRDYVTIFVSTHFMNEAERCDRISLMHAGKILASGTPESLVKASGKNSLNDTFIDYLKEAAGDQDVGVNSSQPDTLFQSKVAHNPVFSLVRLFGYVYRETLEIWRDPVRLTFALLGTAILMFIMGYGLTLDVDDISFSVLDRDQTPESRDYIENISGSRYFIERTPIVDEADLERRMRSGELSVTFEIPPGFGKDLKRGRVPKVAAWIDGAMPFRAETMGGYVKGLHYSYLIDLAVRNYGIVAQTGTADIEARYRYNQDFKSLYAMVPAMIPLLLIFIPAILMALAVVREKEMGSITNLYATPVTKFEFLLGKQLPYIGVSMISYFGLVVLAVFVFDVPIKGSFIALTVAALIYVTVTTGLGMLMSAFTNTQIAALAVTAIVTLLSAINFSGMTHPVSSMEGVGAVIGTYFPTTYFLIISRGVFTKALGFAELQQYFWALLAFIPILTAMSLILLKKQEK